MQIKNSTFKTPLFIILSGIFLLQSCGTPVSEKAPVATTNLEDTTQEIEVIEDSELTPEQMVEQAKQETTEQATILLLQAAALYLQEQKLEKSLYISHQLSKLPLTRSQKNFNELNLAQGLYELGFADLAQTKLDMVKRETPSQRQLRLAAQINVQRGLLVEGIVSYLNYYQSYPTTDITEINYLNSIFARLKPYQLAHLNKRNAYDLDGWLALTNSVSTYGTDEVALAENFEQWSLKYPQHPANLLLEDYQDKSLAANNQVIINNVSVLIPLSGREAILGKTLQAGILAAYGNNQSQQITFIDTNSKPMVEIIAKLNLLQPDFVIGPLLKNHVDQYLTYTNSTKDEILSTQSEVAQASTIEVNELNLEQLNLQQSSSLADIDNENLHSDLDAVESNYDWPTLLLNLPENGLLAEQHYAFSMLPEAEATQAAFSLSKKGFKQGLVLSQNSAIGKRMANSFAQQWRLQTGFEPTIVYYPNGKKMQSAVKGGLDVNLSDERIRSLRNMLQENVKAESRNRRDIDFIYLFGTPDQAKLLKPYIDVNTSPFAQSIPIYASSRSNSDATDRNSRRDLTGLTFTEIPWLLTGKENSPELSSEAKQIWPTRSSALERIYAMGIDSWNLTSKAKKMQLLPLLKHQGETGILQINESRVISRSFYWGRYRSSRIQHVEMD
ncbi:penicillin-binding protein activator [Thalassomonas sp. M1454]|uniref:penicillin-binding protein activator n=1 Tax=Thalassomonas sp. M1454 TaxID=2594477 RepID=UPI001180B906|nr:penicillin-binding protein activator [Thalassomonas sp. M1454]TRX52757.1 hypothetical protein FNN08_15470 [Thalassomonas sp. M1454]